MESKEKSKEKIKISPKDQPTSNEYEDMNKLYKQLYEERQTRSREAQNSSKESLKDEKKSSKESEKDSNKIGISVSNKLLLSYLSSTNTRPIFYINKLTHYPKDQMKENMVSFREMLFEDILKTRTLIPNELPKKTLECAFMTTFGFDTELLIHLAKAKVHLTVANDYNKNTPYVPLIENYDEIQGFNVIQPAKNFHGVFYSCFHPKLWLLKFPDFLRVVVSSGNLTTLDWSIWSNCLWYQDFYKKNMLLKESKSKAKENKEDYDYNKEFEVTLKDYIKEIIPKKIDFKSFTKINLDDYIFDNIEVILIPSFPGRHSDNLYGLSKVRNLIQTLNTNVYKQEEEYVITYQSSSLGQLDSNFISDICYAFLPNCIGKDQALNKIYTDITKNVKVIYPTEKYVADESYAGPDFAQPLFLSEKNYEKPNFLRKIFHQFEGSVDYNFHHGILAHLKVGIVTKSDMKIDDDTIIYYGSHNFTSAAWGKYEKNRTQLSISNTELGILVPGRPGSKALKEEIAKGLPFKFPAEIYGKGNIPWIGSKYFKN